MTIYPGGAIGPDVTNGALGGKAGALAELTRAGLPVPAWFVLSADSLAAAVGDDAYAALRGGRDVALEVPPDLAAALSEAVAAIATSGELLAVRSSALGEDSAEASFAGQLESYLDVDPDDVPRRVADVWRSAFAPRVRAYRDQHGLPGHPVAPAVIVQRMVRAASAGVAFGADPVSGERSTVVVNAVAGLADRLVSGDADADGWSVEGGGRITRTSRAGDRPVLTDAQVRAVAELVRTTSRHLGCPQDIEWAYDADGLWLLQSRPITTLPQGPVVIWDNSNIAESYYGVTTPLTYSFARAAYEGVYRRLLRVFGVSAHVVDANADVLANMIGLVRGRIYYNLLNWYRALALVPGYELNRRFMETMMGVRESLPDELVAQQKPSHAGTRALDLARLVRAAIGLVVAFLSLPTRTRRFYERLDRLLEPPDIAAMSAPQIADHYRAVEAELLPNWDAPLVNDFAAMVFFGLTGVLTKRWCADETGTLPNDLMLDEGGMISAEPARRVRELARLAAAHPELVTALTVAEGETLTTAIAGVPEFQAGCTAYLTAFGNRCLEELKLESPTLSDDPLPLLRSVGNLADRARQGEAQSEPMPNPRRAEAEARVAAALSGHHLRRGLVAWVLTTARGRVRERENLRFERTRLFGIVRQLVVAIGDRLVAAGRLDDGRDVFYLEISEVLAAARADGAPGATVDLRQLVARRRAEFDAYRAEPPPPDRFQVREGEPIPRRPIPEPPGGDAASGIGCCPGVVRGSARVVLDPRHDRVRNGEILVAERTDPGWVMLFPAAAGLLVERGSLLSHSAIVARELNIPTVVAVPGLTRWLRTGDLVELDGTTGRIRRLRKTPSD